MEFLNEVLRFVPPEWDPYQTYDDKLFVLIKVYKNSDEYRMVKEHIPFARIAKVERIQHPFAYGRFLIRKEQLVREDIDPVEIVKTERKSSTVEGIERYIYYNCDSRRVNVRPGGNQYCVIKKVLRPSQGRDSDWYPEYLVTLKQ